MEKGLDGSLVSSGGFLSAFLDRATFLLPFLLMTMTYETTEEQGGDERF